MRPRYVPRWFGTVSLRATGASITASKTGFLDHMVCMVCIRGGGFTKGMSRASLLGTFRPIIGKQECLAHSQSVELTRIKSVGFAQLTLPCRFPLLDRYVTARVLGAFVNVIAVLTLVESRALRWSLVVFFVFLCP